MVKKRMREGSLKLGLIFRWFWEVRDWKLKIGVFGREWFKVLDSRVREKEDADIFLCLVCGKYKYFKRVLIA